MSEPIMLTSPEKLEAQEDVEKAVEEIKQQLFKYKEKIVKLKLKQIGKLNILKDINKKRFKKLQVEVYKDREEVWIDDGSWKGKLLVTFLTPTAEELKDKEFKGKLLFY